MYLSLPLLQEAERWVEITLVRVNDENQPIKHAVKVRIAHRPTNWTLLYTVDLQVSKGGIIQEVREAVGKIAGVPATNIILADLEDYKLAHAYKDTENTSLISEHDLVLAYV